MRKKRTLRDIGKEHKRKEKSMFEALGITGLLEDRMSKISLNRAKTRRKSARKRNRLW